MLGQQLDGLGEHDGLDAVAHIVVVPRVQLSHLGAAEDFQAEVQVGGVIQRAGQVVLVERVVAGLVGHRVEKTAFTQVIAPGVIAVTAQKGIVQVE